MFRESVPSLDAGLDLVVGQAGLGKQRATDFRAGEDVIDVERLTTSGGGIASEHMFACGRITD
jgi:hypothetical protein